MASTGVSVVPITEASGNRHHFCEVFFDGVVVPASNLIGEVNHGWSIAQTTMAYGEAHRTSAPRPNSRDS